MIGVPARPFAVVTGGSSGIGFELAKQFLDNGFDLLIAADTGVVQATASLQAYAPRAKVTALTTDLSTAQGARALHAKIRESGRGVDALAANAGIGLGESFLDQQREDWVKVITTNIIGSLDIIHLVASDMREAGHGRILITSSLAAQVPSPYLAIYSASKSFLESIAIAIREELKGTGISVTALLPGGTETNIWARAGVLNTQLGGPAKKDSAADVAKTGYDALMAGSPSVVHGFKNRLAAAAANVIPDTLLAWTTRHITQPGSAKGHH